VGCWLANAKFSLFLRYFLNFHRTKFFQILPDLAQLQSCWLCYFHRHDALGTDHGRTVHNRPQWQGRAAYFGVIWPSAKYADDLTVMNMRLEAGSPSPAEIIAPGPTALPLSNADLEARAREVAQFLVEIDPDQLATCRRTSYFHVRRFNEPHLTLWSFRREPSRYSL
jgi:hypothetical protein